MYKANKVIKKMKKSGIPLETKMYNLMLKLYAGYYGRKGLPNTNISVNLN